MYSKQHFCFELLNGPLFFTYSTHGNLIICVITSMVKCNCVLYYMLVSMSFTSLALYITRCSFSMVPTRNGTILSTIQWLVTWWLIFFIIFSACNFDLANYTDGSNTYNPFTTYTAYIVLYVCMKYCTVEPVNQGTWKWGHLNNLEYLAKVPQYPLVIHLKSASSIQVQYMHPSWNWVTPYTLTTLISIALFIVPNSVHRLMFAKQENWPGHINSHDTIKLVQSCTDSTVQCTHIQCMLSYPTLAYLKLKMIVLLEYC